MSFQLFRINPFGRAELEAQPFGARFVVGFQLFRINPFGRADLLEFIGDDMNLVSNYSELTHSVGPKNRYIPSVSSPVVSNYSELTHSVGPKSKKEVLVVPV